MYSKFKVGNKVTLLKTNRRIPKYIRDMIRLDRARTITQIFYNKKSQHNEYYLGTNRWDIDITMYPFRADQLRLATKKAGRPREKRKYKRRVV